MNPATKIPNPKKAVYECIQIHPTRQNQAATLLVDHQAGLISLVQDFPPNEFKNNVLALAALAKFFKLPTILTTSFEEGPNGPIDPKELFLIKGATHIALYDKPEYVTPAVDKLFDFFRKNL